MLNNFINVFRKQTVN